MGPNPPIQGPPGGTARPDIFQKIRSQPHDWRTWFKTFPQPAWIFNLETLCFLEANFAASQFYGVTHEEFISRRISGLFPPDDLGAFLQASQQSSEGFVRHGVWRQRAAEGKAVDVELFSCPLLIHGETCRLVVVNDVTERRWAEQMLLQVHGYTEQQLGIRTMELDAAAQEAEAMAEFLQELAGRIPGSMLLENERSLRGALTDASDSFLQLSRMSYAVVQPQELDLSAMAREIAEGIQGADAGPGTIFEIQPHVLVQADPTWMRQALQSLFGYMAGLSRREGPATIHFEAWTEGREVVCALRQPRALFDPELPGKLFQPFQATVGRQKKAGGLVLARRIFAKHSGRIWAENTPSQGVSLFFTLPTGRERAVAG